MTIDRRTLIQSSSLLAAGAGAALLGNSAEAATRPKQPIGYPRIATEEAFITPELREIYATLGEATWNIADPIIMPRQTESGGQLAEDLVDFDNQRLRQMDEAGVSMHLLSLTCPGVQILRPDIAVAMARLANDQLAAAIQRHPTRYRGLAALAPQDPKAAVTEMERAINTLKLNGFIINSHTNNEYLDDKKYWPILEAAEHLDRPIYIHPRTPSVWLTQPFDVGPMAGPFWGYSTEVSVHVMRMFLAGVFDRFPKLQIVIGHLGETIPYYLWRCDWALNRGAKPGGTFSEVFRRNVAITTSGAGLYDSANASAVPALKCAIEAVGADNIMWAIDYPYVAKMKPAVDFLDKADISDQDREKIYHLNAKRIFKLT